MNFEILGPIERIEVIARGSGIRELPRLRRVYGRGSWRKLKGIEFGLMAETCMLLSCIGMKPMV